MSKFCYLNENQFFFWVILPSIIYPIQNQKNNKYEIFKSNPNVCTCGFNICKL